MITCVRTAGACDAQRSHSRTELNIAQENIPEACYLGWQESLINLAKLVEPEINN
jgi:hypothetical protein